MFVSFFDMTYNYYILFECYGFTYISLFLYAFLYKFALLFLQEVLYL